MSELNKLASRLVGRFIAIDGPDGAGKGTQIDRLVEGLSAAGAKVVTAHDPGDTPAGDLIRQILLAPNGVELDIATETLLFMASRAQLVAEKIRPALSAGAVVVCDRFISSTCAYQGAGGVDLEKIVELGRFAVGDTWPDLTIVLDIPAEEGLARIGLLKRGRNQRWARSRRIRRQDQQGQSLFNERPDAMEARSLAFHRRVREIFRSLPAVYPQPVELVDASADPDAVHQRIVEALVRRFA